MKSKRRITLCLLLLRIIFSSHYNTIPWCGAQIHKKALNPSFRRGYGAPGYSRRSYTRRKYYSVYDLFKSRGNNRVFESHTRMYLDEFEVLIHKI